jgi:hypothetical protein
VRVREPENTDIPFLNPFPALFAKTVRHVFYQYAPHSFNKNHSKGVQKQMEYQYLPTP